MPFPARADMQGGSHLFVTLSGNTASFLLAEADLRFGTVELQSRVIPVDSLINLDNIDAFLGENLRIWGKEIGWDLLQCDDGNCMISLCEGECVDGATLLADAALSPEPFYSVVFGTNAYIINDQALLESAAGSQSLFGATQVIQVVADWNKIKVFVVTNSQVPGRDGKVLVREMEVTDTALDQIPEKIMPSLLGVSVRRDELIDAVANLRRVCPSAMHSNVTADLVRSFLTASLFSMKDQVLQSFGMDTLEPHLVISGELAQALPLSYLLLAVIDGLQLRGRYTIHVDRHRVFLPAAISSQHKIFPFPVDIIYPNRYLYLSTEKGASGKENRAVFRGRLVEIGVDENITDARMITGQFGQIVTIPTSGPGRILIQPAHDAYFPNLRKEKHEDTLYLAWDVSEKDDGVIVDCRKIPVIYGPDAQANMGKVRAWIQGMPDVAKE